MISKQEAHIRLDQQNECTAEVVALNKAGMTLELASLTGTFRYMWVRFEIPGKGGACTALCEVLESAGNRVRVRFKHLFPKERVALENALGLMAKNEDGTEANVA